MPACKWVTISEKSDLAWREPNDGSARKAVIAILSALDFIRSSLVIFLFIVSSIKNGEIHLPLQEANRPARIKLRSSKNRLCFARATVFLFGERRILNAAPNESRLIKTVPAWLNRYCH